MLSPHPLPIMEILLYERRYSVGRMVGCILLPFSAPEPESVNSLTIFRRGFFVSGLWTVQSSVAYIIRRHFYVKSQEYSNLQHPLLQGLLG